METIYAGLFFIVLGMLIKVFPNLLAGSNHLSNKEKENAIKNGLPTFACLVMISMGIFIIAGHFVGIGLDKPSLSETINTIVFLTGLVVLIVFGNILVNKRAR